MNAKWEKLLEILAEGGSISVLGNKSSGGNWTFALVRDETTLAQLIDDTLPEDTYLETSADSWDSLLDMIDRYPWVKLYPKTVHTEFRKKLLAAVIARTSDPWILERWEDACSERP